MVDSVEEFSVLNLPYAVLIDFTSQVVDVLKADPAVEIDSASKLETARKTFKDALEKVHSKCKVSLKTIDRKNDQIWRQTRALTKIAAKNPDEAGRHAALKVLDIFNRMPDPTRAKYTMAYGLLDRQLDELENLGEDTLKQALVYAWVKALREGFNKFKQIRMIKSNERADAELGLTTKLHDELCACYSEIVKRLNAIAILMPDDAHTLLNNRINRIISDYRTSLKLAKGKGEPKNNEDEDTEKQDETAVEEDDEAIVNATDEEIDDPIIDDPKLDL